MHSFDFCPQRLVFIHLTREKGPRQVCLFRNPLGRQHIGIAALVLGGGEANETLTTELESRLDLKSDLGDPLRSFDCSVQTGRKSQWDIAAGLALRDLKP